jgi:GNAT superfamily N-acetyltransferase
VIAELPDGLALRPAGEADRSILLAVYAGTREDELALTDWPAEQKLFFVTQQFEAQDQHYRLHYPGAEFLVIERRTAEGLLPVGRLYLHHRPSEIRLMDISLLPAARGSGLGSVLLAHLLDTARRAGKRLSIHVEKMNRARRLYERLGFVVVADVGVYDLMEWRPPDP